MCSTLVGEQMSFSLVEMRLLLVQLTVVTKAIARFGGNDGKPKPFDIQHPTKGEGHRLRYLVLKGRGCSLLSW